MVTAAEVRKFALSFSETDAHPHFDRIAFRVRKKIFSTLDVKRKRVMVKLTLNDQSVFCAFDPAIIYPVPGGWGKKGATYIELIKVRKTMFKDAMTVAFCAVAPPALAEKYQLR